MKMKSEDIGANVGVFSLYAAFGVIKIKFCLLSRQLNPIQHLMQTLD